MKKSIFALLLGLGALIALPAASLAQTTIFACEPEWGALAKDIGGKAVSVFTATTARQDVHHITAKPSLLAAMRKADMVFCTGASLEIGWLPILLKKAGGPDVQPGAKGWLMASEHVRRLNVPVMVDRSMGDVHPEGNPHVHLDPRNMAVIAKVLAEKLQEVDPVNAKSYQTNLRAFEANWQSLLAQWDKEAASLRGKRVVVYHDSWAYLLSWLGMEVAATLEPKPGIPPTASHLEKVLQEVEGKSIIGILTAPHENDDAAKWLSGKTGLPILALPYTVGGRDQADDLPGLFTQTLVSLKGKS